MIKNYLLYKMSQLPQWQEIVKIRILARDANYKFWLESNLFSLVWWLMLVLLVLLWYVWWKLVDKTRLVEICTYGLMVGIIATLYDVIGVFLVLWGYPNMW